MPDYFSLGLNKCLIDSSFYLWIASLINDLLFSAEKFYNKTNCRKKTIRKISTSIVRFFLFEILC